MTLCDRDELRIGRVKMYFYWNYNRSASQSGCGLSVLNLQDLRSMPSAARAWKASRRHGPDPQVKARMGGENGCLLARHVGPDTFTVSH